MWGWHTGAIFGDLKRKEITDFSKEYDKKLNAASILTLPPGQLPSKLPPHHDALELSKQLSKIRLSGSRAALA